MRPDSADSADDSLMMIIAGRVQADDKDPTIKDARRFLVASVTWVSGVLLGGVGVQRGADRCGHNCGHQSLARLPR